jgi:MinD-like ATPase involved in chromosome partitioning or flagellar assembly
MALALPQLRRRPEPPAPPGELQHVLFAGDLRRLKLGELSSSYVVAPGLAPDLGAARALLAGTTPWHALLVDSRVAADAELVAFFDAHHRDLTAAGVRALVVLDRRHEHLRGPLGRYARLAGPDDPAEWLAAALGLARSALARRTAHVVVLSAKGGTGKTSTALGLAEYLPRLRPDLRVALVDADLFDGNVALSLGLAERARSILELAVAARQEGLTADVLRRYLTRTEWGLDILAAPAHSTYRNGHIDPSVIASTYDGLQALGTDVIITDAPPDVRQGTPVSPVFFAPERLASLTILLILGPRKFERDGFARMVDYLRAKGALERAWLVYVQSRPYRRSKDRDLLSGLERMAEENGLRGVAGRLPFDYLVEDAQQAALPFWAVRADNALVRLAHRLRGGSPFQRRMTALARRVLAIAQE